MTEEVFMQIFRLIEDDLVAIVMTRNDVIHAKVKLAVFLEFVCSGASSAFVMSVYRISERSFYRIISLVSLAILNHLSPIVFPQMNRDMWLMVAHDFQRFWAIPNCCGAIDGKHIIIHCPRNSGSFYYNYESSYSFVLMAVCDAQYRFIYIDVGGYGSQNDASIFNACTFGRRLDENQLDLPE